MKKLFIFLFFIFGSFVGYNQTTVQDIFSSYGAQSTPSKVKKEKPMVGLGIHAGYSWTAGILGGDLYFWHLSGSVGWMPTKMPLSGDFVNSVGWNISVYSSQWNEDGFYASFGQASKGFRKETTVNGYYTQDYVKPMWAVLGGYRATKNNWGMKAGLGYGWCDEADTFTAELLISYDFGL